MSEVEDFENNFQKIKNKKGDVKPSLPLGKRVIFGLRPP